MRRWWVAAAAVMGNGWWGQGDGGGGQGGLWCIFFKKKILHRELIVPLSKCSPRGSTYALGEGVFAGTGPPRVNSR
jgi:hypothetical protein